MLLSVLFFASKPSSAADPEPEFSGVWRIDLRTPEQRRNKAECGFAQFELQQSGDRVRGDHSMFTTGCGRMNEGGEGTVVGVVHAGHAILVVSSGRNGAMVLGKAVRRGTALHWQTLERLKEGEPEGDSPLILDEGLLRLVPK